MRILQSFHLCQCEARTFVKLNRLTRIKKQLIHVQVSGISHHSVPSPKTFVLLCIHVDVSRMEDASELTD